MLTYPFRNIYRAQGQCRESSIVMIMLLACVILVRARLGVDEKFEGPRYTLE